MATTTLVLRSLKPFSQNPSLSFAFSSTHHHLKIHHFHNQRFIPRIPLSSFRNNNPLPETECPVPLEQQPVNEFKALSDSFPFSWASGDLVEYCSRLFATGLAFALFVGLPVNLFGSVGPEPEPLKPFLGAVSGGVIVVTFAVVRMYLGWAYVGNRLLSATVEYEETGWYDGQVRERRKRWGREKLTHTCRLFQRGRRIFSSVFSRRGKGKGSSDPQYG
ncbi:uncharacterized protein ycf36 isoform X2 [Nicotiana sylvestris]|uniref:uncharacterized protein ycf36 isoform X2 n=1 Tax=Nicotiana sylvestris TaxID=4096 RepID=UPI00388C577D